MKPFKPSYGHFHQSVFCICNNIKYLKDILPLFTTHFSSLIWYTAYPRSWSTDSNTSPPIVSLSGLRQISIMLYIAWLPQSESFLALLKYFRAVLIFPWYLETGKLFNTCITLSKLVQSFIVTDRSNTMAADYLSKFYCKLLWTRTSPYVVLT